ncbi:MAG: Dps family protein, partial [Acidimicrobiaceae bacterium]
MEINKDKIKDTWQGVVERAKGVKDFLTDKVDGVARAIERKVEDPNGAIAQMDEGMTGLEDAIAGGAKRVLDSLKGIRRGSRNDELVDALKDVLGNAFSMYIRTHGAHWNVIGKDFSQYHGLFEEIYEDVYGSIDPLAENIRKLEGEAPGSLSEFDELDGLKDATPSEASEQSLAQDILNANRVVLES